MHETKTTVVRTVTPNTDELGVGMVESSHKPEHPGIPPDILTSVESRKLLGTETEHFLSQDALNSSKSGQCPDQPPGCILLPDTRTSLTGQQCPNNNKTVIDFNRTPEFQRKTRDISLDTLTSETKTSEKLQPTLDTPARTDRMFYLTTPQVAFHDGPGLHGLEVEKSTAHIIDFSLPVTKGRQMSPSERMGYIRTIVDDVDDDFMSSSFTSGSGNHTSFSLAPRSSSFSSSRVPLALARRNIRRKISSGTAVATGDTVEPISPRSRHRQAMSLLYDKVVNIINKPPEKRLDSEIEQILPWFRKRSDLFNSLHADIVRDIVKNCRFEPIDKNKVIIRQMDKGDRFYIILSGSVAIHINTTLTEEEFEDVLKTQLEEEAHCERDKERVLDRNKYGIYVGKIDAGKSFGELALINADCVRNATIISDETTDLLSVDRDLYNRSLRAFQAQEFAERKDFVGGFGMFQNWVPRYKKMMAFSLRKKMLKFEDTIVKQGAPVDGIYFIIRGQVKIRVDPSHHSQQYSNLYPLGDIAELEKEKARQLLRKEMNLASQRTSDRRSMYVRRAMPTSDGAAKRPNLKPFELCLAGAIDVIGDLEMAMGLTSYSQTVVCTEESTIYHLDQRNYDRLIEKRNPAALELLRDIVHTKLTLHFSRLPEESIPLYRFFLYQLDEKEKDARRIAMAPRSKTSLAQEEANIGNLQKGPLVNMYGPGSVFYLIRKRAKEMEARRKRRNVIPAANFRTGISHKSSPVAMALAATRGIIDTATATAVYNNHHATGQHARGRGGPSGHHQEMEDYPDPGPPTPTESMLNLYGPPPHESPSEHGLDPADYLDGERGAWGVDYDDEFDDGYDWASSDLALSQLEARMSQWYHSLGTAIKGACVVPLHRYQAEEENRPKPGNKVYVKLRSKPKNVSFFAIQSNNNDDDSSSDEAQHKPSAQGSRSPVSSWRRVETRAEPDKANDAISEITEHLPLESRTSQRPRSTKSEPVLLEHQKQRKRKQYTKEEYLALKAELRRRQKAWISMLGSRSYTVV